MKIENMVKKYNITLEWDDSLRARNIETEAEKEMIISAKPEILAYFKRKKAEEDQIQANIIEKAKNNKDGLFLVIDEDLGFGIYVHAARRLTDEEKKKKSEWYRDIGMVGVGRHTELEYLTHADMPKRKTNGTFSGGGEFVWIISPEEYDNYLKLNNERCQMKKREEEEEKLRLEEERRRRIAEKESLVSKVDDWTVEESTMFDEGGRTKAYTHTFQINGDRLSFLERSVFDFGVVITPKYSIDDSLEKGGIALMRNNTLQWYTSSKGNGWIPVRPLTDGESVCYTLIAKYGKYAGTGVRM